MQQFHPEAFIFHSLKSLGPIDGEKKGFVLYEYKIKQRSSFCKYLNIAVIKKIKENNVNSKQKLSQVYGVTCSFVSISDEKV